MKFACEERQSAHDRSKLPRRLKQTPAYQVVYRLSPSFCDETSYRLPLLLTALLLFLLTVGKFHLMEERGLSYIERTSHSSNIKTTFIHPTQKLEPPIVLLPLHPINGLIPSLLSYFQCQFLSLFYHLYIVCYFRAFMLDE